MKTPSLARTTLVPRRSRLALALAASLALVACGSDDDDRDMTDGSTINGGNPLDGDGDEDDDRTLIAFVSGATPDFQTGQIERIELNDDGIVSTGTTPATGSDIRVASDGDDVYQIGRFMIDSLTRFDADDLDSPVWQYSVNGEETGANPYTIVFQSENKAYVTRYGSGQIWIVDPNAENEANFRTGTIDLSAYDNDGVPEISEAVLVEDRLFVLMERLEDFAPVKTGYLAVIDTATDTEIDTGQGTDGLFGIALETVNPNALSYDDARDELTVVGRGNFFLSEAVTGDAYSGGIETIDAETYVNELLLDDGSADDNDGFFYDAVVSPDGQGFLLTYAAFGDTTLRRYDPMLGTLDATPYAGLDGVDIGVLAIDPEGRLWVGLNDAATPGFRVLDPESGDVLIDRVPTEFNPNGIVFLVSED